jgi:hypothetical protein
LNSEEADCALFHIREKKTLFGFELGNLRLMQSIFSIFILNMGGGGEVESVLGPLGTSATPGLLYLPRVFVRIEKSME